MQIIFSFNIDIKSYRVYNIYQVSRCQLNTFSVYSCIPLSCFVNIYLYNNNIHADMFLNKEIVGVQWHQYKV